MDNYEWQKNKAIVDRMYYSERVMQTTTLFALLFTGTNALHMRNGYFASKARSYLLPTFKWWAILTFPTIAILQYPLTTQERSVQMHKRLTLGKWLYTLYHLDGPVEGADNSIKLI